MCKRYKHLPVPMHGAHQGHQPEHMGAARGGESQRDQLSRPAPSSSKCRVCGCVWSGHQRVSWAGSTPVQLRMCERNDRRYSKRVALPMPRARAGRC